jgi:hypothetical protein
MTRVIAGHVCQRETADVRRQTLNDRREIAQQPVSPKGLEQIAQGSALCTDCNHFSPEWA